MIVRSLKVFDPSAPRDADACIAKHGNIGRSVCLQRSHKNCGDILWGKTLGAQDVLWQLIFGTNDLSLLVSEEVEPCFVYDSKILRRTCVDQNVLAAAANEIDEDIHLFALVPVLHPVDLGTRHPECA